MRHRKGNTGTSMHLGQLKLDEELSDAALLRQAALEMKQWQAELEKLSRVERADLANRRAEP